MVFCLLAISGWGRRHCRHWLPVHTRIDFKMATMTVWLTITLSSGHPAYIRELISLYQPSRSLWSSNQLLLTVPRANLTIGQRTFSHSSPGIWILECHSTIRQRCSLHQFIHASVAYKHFTLTQSFSSIMPLSDCPRLWFSMTWRRRTWINSFPYQTYQVVAVSDRHLHLNVPYHWPSLVSCCSHNNCLEHFACPYTVVTFYCNLSPAAEDTLLSTAISGHHDLTLLTMLPWTS